MFVTNGGKCNFTRMYENGLVFVRLIVCRALCVFCLLCPGVRFLLLLVTLLATHGAEPVVCPKC